MFKKPLAKEYKMKNLRKIKTIIKWQIMRDTVVRTMKVDQSAFIRDLVIKEELIELNANFITIRARSAIKMIDPGNYKVTELCELKYLIGKLYLACDTRPDIAFVVRKPCKYNTNLRKDHL